MDKQPNSSLRERYAHLSDEEFAEFRAGFDEYLEIVLRIFERTRPEPSDVPDDLTQDTDAVSLEQPRSESFD